MSRPSVYLMSSDVFRDMFSLDNSSTQTHSSSNDQNPIYLDADAQSIAVLFDMLNAPSRNHWALHLSSISVASCIVLSALADTYSFCRIKSTVERTMGLHLRKHPIRVLKIASGLGSKGLDFGRKAMTHMVQATCVEDSLGRCVCGIEWEDFDGVDQAWRSEIALALLETGLHHNKPVKPVLDQNGKAVHVISCVHLRAAVERFNSE